MIISIIENHGNYYRIILNNHLFLFYLNFFNNKIALFTTLCINFVFYKQKMNLFDCYKWNKQIFNINALTFITILKIILKIISKWSQIDQQV